MLYQELDQMNTPCYLIKADKFKNNVEQIREAFQKSWKGKLLLGYSVKTNHNRELLRLAKEEGLFAEVVSDDEYVWAGKNGFSGEKIIYNGVQKSEKMLLEALKNGSLVNLDNLDEVKYIEEHKGQLIGKKPHIGLRINFNLEQECLGETTAGDEVSRFGICVENGDFEQAVLRLRNAGISPEVLHLHYSSKTRSLNIFSVLAEKACDIAKQYKLLESIRFVDMGGGFFGGQKMAGKPSMQEYAETVCGTLGKYFRQEKVTLVLEPGASILATAIDYISRVIQVREIRDTNVVTLDGSCLHINPFFADRKPVYKLVTKGEKRAQIKKQIVCGATCMETDRILKLENQPMIKKGDFLYFNNAGAYTMAFNSFFINLPPSVYISQGDGCYSLCRGRELKWSEENL